MAKREKKIPAKKNKKKEQKKPAEPQYYLSATNLPAYNYKVYHMKPLEKVLYFLVPSSPVPWWATCSTAALAKMSTATPLP